MRILLNFVHKGTAIGFHWEFMDQHRDNGER